MTTKTLIGTPDPEPTPEPQEFTVKLDSAFDPNEGVYKISGGVDGHIIIAIGMSELGTSMLDELLSFVDDKAPELLTGLREQVAEHLAAAAAAAEEPDGE